ncbi:MAG TPA: hypothetical protein DCZ10_17920 [Pelotomaculum sp.]|nr:hypothetical protein [Pelotomaculum sp.]
MTTPIKKPSSRIDPIMTGNFRSRLPFLLALYHTFSRYGSAAGLGRSRRVKYIFFFESGEIFYKIIQYRY